LVFGHSGEPLEPHDLWTAWRFDPGVIIPLILSAVLFLRGARRSHGVSAWQMFCFWTGWIALVLSLVSPLHPLGEVLFSAHMAQHEILMLIAAPLIVLSCPLVAFVWGLPFESRRVAGRVARVQAFQRIWQAITRPSVAWCIHAIALWCWHAPVLFQATLTSEWVHTAQHLSFLLSALLFWWSLFNVRKAGGYGTGVLYVFTTAVHTSLLGALLTFAPTVWYPAYTSTAATWGLTPMEDQQIGGLIMWVPGGVVYLIAGLVLFSRWLRESDAKIRQSEYAS
jgi:cytochrome c oxidase assembly factor CtaG